MEGYEIQANRAEMEARGYADSAFGKTLASVILAEFPVCSIIAIILGANGLKNVDKADEIASNYGVSAGGKRLAAKIMGKIGFISGIVMTAFWTIYIIWLVIFVVLMTQL